MNGLNHFATMPGRVLGMTVHENRLFVTYETNRKWWQFWKRDVAMREVAVPPNPPSTPAAP